ncbi:MAG: immune inhibitor A domain-containing protein, partial [Nocardioides sp.]
MAVLPFVTVGQAAAAEPTLEAPPQATAEAKKLDNRTHPLAAQQVALRHAAIDQLVSGEAALKGKGRARTIQMTDGTRVDYPASQHANLLTFLVEFGEDDPADLADPDFPAAGPSHNEIPEPGDDDNVNYWKPDFNRGHYLDMFFNGMAEQDGESFKDLYAEMSSGRFDLTGDVSDWVTVPHAGAYYSDAEGYENQPEMTAFIGDSANAWYDAALEDMSDAEVKDYLADFDVWDRYDMDGDGDYHEPDGYIDHFQAVHAGPGEEAGAAPWTIWSHRWAANIDGFGEDGPAEGSCDACYPAGGVEIGDTGYFIYDYTTEPEDGGLGVFAHEFAHDLGLPDYYDTNGGDNGNGFWTLMDSGSWLGHGDGSIGSSAGHMGPTEKLFLGWYGAQARDGFEDLAVVDGLADDPTEVTLGPSYHATDRKQAVLVTLPDGNESAEGPLSGDYLYSGTRDGTSVTATSPTISLPEGSPELSARVAYSIEQDYDFAYLQVSDDDGATWTSVTTSESGSGTGITGNQPTFTDLTADLSGYAGEDVLLRWAYVTDGNTHGVGLLVQSLSVGDYSTAFGATNDWALDGFFSVVDGAYDLTFAQSYLAENRTFDGYDVTLGEGPYNFGSPYTAPNKVDHFSYEDGLLIWYSNGKYGDNNSSEHPGGGANLPVDAN